MPKAGFVGKEWLALTPRTLFTMLCNLWMGQISYSVTQNFARHYHIVPILNPWPLDRLSSALPLCYHGWQKLFLPPLGVIQEWYSSNFIWKMYFASEQETLKLIRHICKLRRNWSVANTTPVDFLACWMGLVVCLYSIYC